MPGMDGLEVLRRLKLIDKKLPVIMISAFASWEKEQMARHLGCVDYLSKPLSMKHFKNVVCKSIEQATG
jgi:DNA-binding response OmpR family regulator